MPVAAADREGAVHTADATHAPPAAVVLVHLDAGQEESTDDDAHGASMASAAPATAALWAMFLSNPEVQALRPADAPNVMYGEQPSDLKMKERLKGKNVWDWELNDSTVKYWHWTNAKENEEFRNKVLKAVKQQR